MRLDIPAPAITSSMIVGRVRHIDRFGNLITNLGSDVIQRWGGGVIELAATRITRISRTFSDVEPGEPVAYLGSSGVLEIAVRNGSAAQRLSVQRGDGVI